MTDRIKFKPICSHPSRISLQFIFSAPSPVTSCAWDPAETVQPFSRSLLLMLFFLPESFSLAIVAFGCLYFLYGSSLNAFHEINYSTFCSSGSIYVTYMAQVHFESPLAMTAHFFEDRISILLTTYKPEHMALCIVKSSIDFYGMNEKTEYSSSSCGINPRNYQREKADTFFQLYWIFPGLSNSTSYNT